jgi:hypothetical protein
LKLIDPDVLNSPVPPEFEGAEAAAVSSQPASIRRIVMMHAIQKTVMVCFIGVFPFVSVVEF